jgi:hypothetical protein
MRVSKFRAVVSAEEQQQERDVTRAHLAVAIQIG